MIGLVIAYLAGFMTCLFLGIWASEILKNEHLRNEDSDDS